MRGRGVTDHIEPESLIWGYIAVGVWFNSALHTWYVGEVYPGVRLSLPFTDLFGLSAPIWVAHVGAIVAGAFAGIVFREWLRSIHPIEALTLPDLLTPRRIVPGATAGVLVILTSQTIAGASWSKAVLDVVLLCCAGLLLLSFVRPLSLWNLVSVYAALASVLLALGSQWIDFADRFSFPHFPAFTYFAMASIYIIAVSAVVIALDNLELDDVRRRSRPTTGLSASTQAVEATGRTRPRDEPPSLDDVESRYRETTAELTTGTVGTMTVTDEAQLARLTRTGIDFMAACSFEALYRHLVGGDGDDEAVQSFLQKLDFPHRLDLLLETGLIDEPLRDEARLLWVTANHLQTGNSRIAGDEALAWARRTLFLSRQFSMLKKDQLA